MSADGPEPITLPTAADPEELARAMAEIMDRIDPQPGTLTGGLITCTCCPVHGPAPV